MTETELKEKLHEAFKDKLEVHIRARNHVIVWRGKITKLDGKIIRVKLAIPTPDQFFVGAKIGLIATLRVPVWEKVER